MRARTTCVDCGRILVEKDRAHGKCHKCKKGDKPVLVCEACGERPILIKKRGLCSVCYQKLRDHGGLVPTLPAQKRELDFVQAYFNHKNWISQPATFRVGQAKYTPDFYDAERGVFIEVSGTRQAYHAAKDKYGLFRKCYPNLLFEIRKPDGTLLDEDEERLSWNELKVVK